MKTLLTGLILFSFFAIGGVFAADTSYSATLKGIECAACKKTISQAIGKIKGVKTIRIAKVGEDQHQLTIVTDGSAAISKGEALKALGKDSHYEVTNWSKAD